MEITLKQNRHDPEMIEAYTLFEGRKLLCFVCHEDCFYKESFFNRLRDGEEVVVELKEVDS